MKIIIIKINEKVETSIGRANKMQDINRMVNPIIITGFRPILSEMLPLIGENIV